MTLNPSIATFVSLVAAVACFGDLSHADEPPTGTGKEPPIEAAGRLRIAIDPVRPWYYARIEGVDPGAAIRVVPARTMPVAASLSEGYYLSVLHESEAPALDRPRLLRVLVTDVGTNGKAVLQVAPSIAAMLKPGTFLALVRPATATTARLRQFPDSVVQAEGSVPWPQSAAELQVCRSESLTHLRQIGLALHSFHATFNRFPPAIVVGPDGKPWHSWRVLLLPYLDERALYEEYKWDEPWDGPNNRRLIEKTPRVYSDPVHGENKDHFAHYAAVTGAGMAFSAEGAAFDGKEIRPDELEGRAIGDISDGSSETLIVGPVAPDRKIEWTKPEDVVIPEKLPRLQKPGIFAFPYPTGKGNTGLFLRADGAVLSIPDEIDASLLRGALTIAGSELLDWDEILGGNLLVVGKKTPVVYVTVGGRSADARVVLEPVLEPPPIRPPVRPRGDRDGNE